MKINAKLTQNKKVINLRSIDVVSNNLIFSLFAQFNACVKSTFLSCLSSILLPKHIIGN